MHGLDHMSIPVKALANHPLLLSGSGHAGMTCSGQHTVGDMFRADQGDLWWHSHVEHHRANSLKSQEGCPLCMFMGWAGGEER